ncbi:MAG: hypothetical protein Q9190_006055 [Brigantiaea leucoxantha]
MALLSRISSRASGKLRGADNYYEWQSEMRLRLQLAGLYGLIDGSSKKPELLHLSSHASEKVRLMARQREGQIQKHRLFANIWTETRDMKLTADDIFKMHAIDIVAKNSPRVAMLLREKARTEEALPDRTEIFRLMDVYLGERRFDSAIDTASDIDSSNGTKRYDSNDNNVEKISGNYNCYNGKCKHKTHSKKADCFHLHPQEAPGCRWWHRRMNE